MSGHTPGPWVDGGCRRTMAGERRSIELRQGTPSGRLVAIVETESDARVMAAAPGLLDFSERAVAGLLSLERSRSEPATAEQRAAVATLKRLIADGRAAITRAKGGQP